MATHASVPVTSRSAAPHHLSRAVLAVPVVLGVVYGFYAAAILRGGGAVTGGQIVLGVVSGAAVMVLGLCLLRFQSALPRELRATAYATLFGGGMGFLYSLAGHSVLRSSGIGAVLGGGMFLVAFYVFYTHED
ncbi:hypothetical protein DWB77_04034 [Streptomyces hundungensis]|uniref:Uncharacterized protein n=1 Tax=Streptomyces hundungensis TaxID=1077946 RepID=A0A387HNF0_9ACTN|nr:hypothetical protein [Streptomyces hundungensis]AYG81867.1 hypothetical protein DWB77_04034 [Streptomyces hundungensis]